MKTGWIDCLVQLRSIEEEARSQFQTVLADNHVSTIVSAGYAPERDEHLAHFSAPRDSIHVVHAWGVHPEIQYVWNEERCRNSIRKLKPSLIGEVGLDKRCLDVVDWRTQEYRAEGIIELGSEFGLPLLWHSVRATERSLKLIRKAAKLGVRGLWHGFHGSHEVASEVVGLGWKLGIGPSLLRDSSHRLRHLVGSLPLDALLLESDWPQPRGNYALAKTGQTLAELQNLRIEDLQVALERNFFDLVDSNVLNPSA